MNIRILNQLIVFFLILWVFFACSSDSIKSEDYTDCTIYRDQWGVPHIHGKTDKDVAYGLAWAGCEDDFGTLQEQMLAINGRFGEVKGMDGIAADIAIKYMGIKDYSRRHLHQLEEKTLKMIDGYVAGVNAYVKLHPEEVLLDIYPLKREDLVAGYLLGLVEISGASADLQKLADGSIIKQLGPSDQKGSNAFAVSADMTDEGQTFLAINSHQPMQGWYSWYEAHLISDEGLNILGGTFPGAATIFHGTNEYLGWAHTVNQADFSDVYQLTMHPAKVEHYRFDDQWLPLKRKVLRSWVKLFGPIKIPISRTIYESKFGITFKVGEHYFAWRFQAGESIKAIEQWYKMNLATNFDEWKAALSTFGMPCTNIVYADIEDNIYYVSHGKHHKKDASLDWSGIIQGNRSEVLWSEETWPLDSLPQVTNPKSGFVFNTNNTPYSSSSNNENPVVLGAQKTMGYDVPLAENSRSLRYQELMDTVTSLSYDEFLEIKYDRIYPNPMRTFPYSEEQFLHLDAEIYPEHAKGITLLNEWNRSTHKDNKIAAYFLLARDALYQKYKKTKTVEAADYIDALEVADKVLTGVYGDIEVPLGDFQRHRRGDVDMPIGGGADVIGAIYSAPDDDGLFTAFTGESYIQIVRFDSLKGPIIESVNAYGSSARLGDKHYTDQMQMFVDQELKPMTLDLEEVKRTAVESYHPKSFSTDR